MSDDYKIQASFRFGQNQQAMLNLRGESAQELKYHLGEAAEGDFVQALTHLDTTLAAGSAAASVTSASAPPPQPPAQYQQPAQQAGPPQQGYQQTAAPTCPHGTRSFKNGVGARGPWAAYFCPLPKGTPGACDPEWVKA